MGVLAFELAFGESPFNINEQEDLKKIVYFCWYRSQIKWNSLPIKRYQRSSKNSFWQSWRKIQNKDFPARISSKWNSSKSIKILRVANSFANDSLLYFIPKTKNMRISCFVLFEDYDWNRISLFFRVTSKIGKVKFGFPLLAFLRDFIAIEYTFSFVVWHFTIFHHWLHF